MTATEFRHEFDLLYNNIMSDMAPGLDDYEVSVFLTQAQEEIVSQLYGGSGNFDGFESNEKVRRNLANLIHTTQVQDISNPTAVGRYFEYDITLSGNLLVLISERAEVMDTVCNAKKYVNVQPVKYDEINKILENPFRRPNNHKVLRMDMDTTHIKIISASDVSTYEYNWLQKPAPIILSDLPSGFTINGLSNAPASATAPASALDESLHRPIIKYAVQLAEASWASNNKK